MNLFTLAAKNLTRRRGRTGLTILGVAIAVSVLFSLLPKFRYEKELNNEVNSIGCIFWLKGQVPMKPLHSSSTEEYTKVSSAPDLIRYQHSGYRIGHPHAYAPISEEDEKTARARHIYYASRWKICPSQAPWKLRGGSSWKMKPTSC